jgi:pimeloyl-ACP methyl ester carboxylesterase
MTNTDPGGPALPHVEGVEHEDVIVRGLRLHVAFAGPSDGPPVILQHGWPQHWYEWRHLIGPLAQAGKRVIVPDFRGFGWSEHPADGDFRKETLADDLVALCAVLGHERVAYVGHDWGCWVGWLLCLRQPQLIERALLLSVSPPFPPEGPPDPMALLRLSRLWYQVVLAAPGPAAAKLAFIRQVLVQGRHGGWGPGELETYLEPLRQPAQVRATTLLYRQFVTRELPRAIGGRYQGRLTMPVRFMAGRLDPLFDEEVVDRARPHADDYDGEALDGVGHFLPEEAPDLLRDRALAFLALDALSA